MMGKKPEPGKPTDPKNPDTKKVEPKPTELSLKLTEDKVVGLSKASEQGEWSTKVLPALIGLVKEESDDKQTVATASKWLGEHRHDIERTITNAKGKAFELKVPVRRPS
ncbi:MAG TPA: hypothetical protein VJ021_00205 [Thermoplasmata archaeon]|nr:hypothetical protein [Thermoplasmata archaeon]